MDDPNNHLETICPSFPEMVEHWNSVCKPKYSFPLDEKLAHDIYENIKPEILIRLYSCDAIETHLNCEISLETKRTMCFQQFETWYFCSSTTEDNKVVPYNSDHHKPWCMQEWLLPSLSRPFNVFVPIFDFRNLRQSLREYPQAQNNEVVKYSFWDCYNTTSDAFCELLFMYLLVKHKDMPIEQMMRDHTKYQSVYEQYACRQWLAQHEADGIYGIIIPLTAEDLDAIDAIDINNV